MITRTNQIFKTTISNVKHESYALKTDKNDITNQPRTFSQKKISKLFWSSINKTLRFIVNNESF